MTVIGVACGSGVPAPPPTSPPVLSLVSSEGGAPWVMPEPDPKLAPDEPSVVAEPELGPSGKRLGDAREAAVPPPCDPMGHPAPVRKGVRDRRSKADKKRRRIAI